VANLSQQERMQEVLRMLESRDSVHVAELSKAFAVSEVTVRSDLSQLARQGLVARVRGGVRALERGQSELGFDFRLRLEVERKRAIAKAAAAMVDEGEAVVTNGLLIAAALSEAPGISVLVTGGMLRLQAMSLVGDLGAEALRTTRISKGFLGARGLSLEAGLMDLNPDEVRIKREMAGVCERVVCIADGTKWYRTALLPFVATEQVDVIVTDTSAPAEEVKAWEARGARIVRVDPVEGGQPGHRRQPLVDRHLHAGTS
jgi:DeoR/GlpR family transcriptional regulator of sugar metabolism